MHTNPNVRWILKKRQHSLLEHILLSMLMIYAHICPYILITSSFAVVTSKGEVFKNCSEDQICKGCPEFKNILFMMLVKS